MPPDHSNLKAESFDISERQKYVAELFDTLAPKYDRFNRWVSLFRDAKWRQETVRQLQERATGVVLDLAAGTGDLAQAALLAGAQQVHVFDIAFEMLSFAKRKIDQPLRPNQQVTFELGSANQLPFQSESIDGIVSGFAIRNIYHFLDEVLSEIYRVLKRGGRLAVLELSQPGNPFIRLGFRLHMKTVMPLIGRIIAGNSEPFQYLYQTTMTFLKAKEFAHKLTEAGFHDVQFQKYLFGGIAIHSGCK
ncbi:MAG: ubiquinone/menaquinone biosynthesis methyltransferase [bacterium]